MRDYLDIEYDPKRRPKTSYPELLANHVATMAGMRRGQSLLEVGAGRAEVAAGFVRLGLHVTAIDSAPSALEHARRAGASFVTATIEPGCPLPCEPDSYDYVFSKSFIEHVREPLPFLEACREVLRPGGTVVVLTPDWEANYKVFFDDVTHVSPFSRPTMQQALELSGFEEVRSFRFRQLPVTWGNPAMNAFSAALAPFVPVRTTNKFFRWSRELMLCGIATKPGLREDHRG